MRFSNEIRAGSRHKFLEWLTYLAALLPVLSRAEGVFVYKNQSFHPDSSAYVIRYQQIEAHDVITWVIVDGKRLRFERSQFHIWADLPEQLPNNLISDSDKMWLSKNLGNIENIRKRFPKSIPITENSFQILNSARSQISEGMVRYEKVWINYEAYRSLMAKKQEELEAKQRALKEEELKRQITLKEEDMKKLIAIKEKESAEANRLELEQEKLKTTQRIAIESKIIELNSKIAKLRETNNSLARNLLNLVDQHND